MKKRINSLNDKSTLGSGLITNKNSEPFLPANNQYGRQFPNEMRHEVRAADQHTRDFSPREVKEFREFLHNKLPRKHASQQLLLSIKEKIKATRT